VEKSTSTLHSKQNTVLCQYYGLYMCHLVHKSSCAVFLFLSFNDRSRWKSDKHSSTAISNGNCCYII